MTALTIPQMMQANNRALRRERALRRLTQANTAAATFLATMAAGLVIAAAAASYTSTLVTHTPATAFARPISN